MITVQLPVLVQAGLSSTDADDRPTCQRLPSCSKHWVLYSVAADVAAGSHDCVLWVSTERGKGRAAVLGLGLAGSGVAWRGVASSIDCTDTGPLSAVFRCAPQTHKRRSATTVPRRWRIKTATYVLNAQSNDIVDVMEVLCGRYVGCIICLSFCLLSALHC